MQFASGIWLTVCSNFLIVSAERPLAKTKTKQYFRISSRVNGTAWCQPCWDRWGSSRSHVHISAYLSDPVYPISTYTYCGWFGVAVKPKFHLARHVSTRHDSTRWICRAHAFWLCRACRQRRWTHSTRRARLARHVRHDERYLCNLYIVMICKLFTNLLEYTLI